MKIENLSDCHRAAAATGFSWEEIAQAFAVDYDLPPLEPSTVKVAVGPVSAAVLDGLVRMIHENGQGVAEAAGRRNGELTDDVLADLFESTGAKQDLVALGINAPVKMRGLNEAELLSLRREILERRSSVIIISTEYDAACIELDACVREIVGRLPEPPQP